MHHKYNKRFYQKSLALFLIALLFKQGAKNLKIVTTYDSSDRLSI